MHCNLRPPDVAPVVLSCTAAYVLHMHINCYIPTFNQNSDIGVRFSDPYFINESKNLTFLCCDLDFWQLRPPVHIWFDIWYVNPFRHLLTPPVRIRGGMGKNSKLILRAIICASSAVFILPIFCSVRKSECFKVDRGRKSRPNFALLIPSVKNKGQMSEWIFARLIGPNHWYTVGVSEIGNRLAKNDMGKTEDLPVGLIIR